ncbi:MAG: transketolase [Methyloligellaceae bacterium]
MAEGTDSNNTSVSKEMANAIRFLSMDAVQAANSGHPGMPMGMADVATVLFNRFLKFDSGHPDWPARDRFVLSAGHGSMLQYALLHLNGYPGMSLDSLRNFRQLGSNTAGHPEFGHTVGVETTTGPLGQGLANAVGMALAERLMAARLGEEICGHFTYVIAGDGCLMEGISHEAISLAGHLKLGKLIVLFDDNQISIDGSTDLTVSDDQIARFGASGWHTVQVDGHDHDAIARAIEEAQNTGDKPSMIACQTIIGYGAPNKQGTSSTHGAPLGAEEIEATRKALDWPHAPFEIPEDIMSAWKAAGTRGRNSYEEWLAKFNDMPEDQQKLLTDPIDNTVKASITSAVAELKSAFSEEGAKLASRVSSQKVLEKLIPIVPGLIGGSADLTGSNGTLTSHHSPVSAPEYSGSYIYYGVREHAMAAVMNGLALHGGFIPYGATFLVFTDYCRPSIRLSALMGQRVIYVMTHDSIGLGEDGPTHQPVEHLAALRAIPNLNVLRPADSVECAECWEIALESADTPSVLVLSRQGLPLLRTDNTTENLSRNGAYVLRDVDGARDITLIATGSEVELAVAAVEQLAADNIKAAVVSMPSWELFEGLNAAEQSRILGTAPRIGIEAAIDQGWSKWLGEQGSFVGMNSFGASAPAGALFEHFNITVTEIVDRVRKTLEG